MVVTPLLVGVAYYAGAWLGVRFTITTEGIAILWPPNAILLAAFLILPYRQWPAIGLAAVIAEVAADIPAFPIWSAVAFGLINLFEVSLAGVLIRRAAGEHFHFDRLRNGALFLLFGPLIASAVAALLGASIYLLLERADTTYFSLWRIWWYGDALGQLLLTPLIVVIWRWLEQGLPALRWQLVAEAVLLWLAVASLGLQAFVRGAPSELEFYFTPVWLTALGILAAIRLGVAGAAATVALIAAIAIGHLTRDLHPYGTAAPQFVVWLTQEYLAIVAVVAVGLALLLREIADQREALRRNKRELQAANEALERRVDERTSELNEVNQDLRSANEQLAAIAATDELTGIANRRQFRTEAQRELHRLRQSHETAAMIMVDLDRFKSVNDQYGHEAGDKVLRAIVEPIHQTIRPRDLFGRMGGEEFVILLAGVDLTTATHIAERVRATIAGLAIEHRGRTIHVTASFGVSQWDGEGGLDDLFRCADGALYRAKERGRNRVEHIDASAFPARP